MVKYEIKLKQLSTNRYTATITANGHKFVDCGKWHTEDEARREANSLLTKVELLNGDWNGDHSTATYHYLHYGAI